MHNSASSAFAQRSDCISAKRTWPSPSMGTTCVLKSFHQASLVSGMSSIVLHAMHDQSSDSAS